MDLSFLEMALKGAVPLTPNNFTPRARTPWGGKYIGLHIKDQISPESVGQVVGESWDFSCEPSFPSRIVGTPWTLIELFQRYPEAILSSALYQQSKTAACEILVKFVDAQEDLSVQVHPSDDDPFLAHDESGKPESWLILHAEAGAGIYLGFKPGLTRARLAQFMSSGDDLREFLQFVPVQVGDYFEIPAGTCHAIGKGVTLLEPQRVLFGKKARTYRMYDWGRRYNSKGEKDPQGTLRELHIEESLRLANPELHCGEAFLAKLRSPAQVHDLGEGLTLASYGHNPYYRTHSLRIKAHTSVEIALEAAYGAMLPTEGYFIISTAGTTDSYWQKGQPGLLPAACFPLKIRAVEDTSLHIVTPVGAKIQWRKM